MNNLLILFIILLIILLIKLQINTLSNFIVGPPLYKKTKKGKKTIIIHNDKIPYYFSLIRKLNGYKYYVGGGLANSYYSYGFKHSEIKKYFNILEYKFKLIWKKMLYKNLGSEVKSAKLVPILALCIKEINQITRNNIDRINKIQDKMFKKEQKSKQGMAKNKLG